MISLLTKERKLLLAVTVIVVIVSATLVWQTYQTMQIYNAADAVCSTVRTGMSKDELYRHAQANRTTISIIELNGLSNQAKLGFNQSYTYFTWRNTKYELTSYCEELVNTEAIEYFRPNFWPNTPDILPFSL